MLKNIILTAFIFSGIFSLHGQDIMPPENFSSGGADQLGLSGENISVAIRWVANEYLSPETERIDRNYISFESFDEVAGEDVRVEVWGLTEARLDIYIFVHDRTAEKWWVYGRANKEGNGIWVTHGVRFGEGAHQGQRFTVRAAIMRQPPSGKLIRAEEWQRNAIAISDPVYVSIKRRLIRPYRLSDTVAQPQLWLSTIDHLTVSPTEPMVVPPSAGIAGTFALPVNPEVPASDLKMPYIYVLIRSTAADRWRVCGPAVLNGAKWEIRDVDIGDPGEPQWVKFKISAVMTNRKLAPDYVEYDDWWENKIAASDPVEVSVKPHTPAINRTFPEIEMTFLQTRSDTQTVFTDVPLAVDSLEDIIEIGGTVTHLPQGASIWLLVNPLGTPLWEVHGKAIVTRPSWRLPVVHSGRFNVLDQSQYRMQAIVSTSTLTPGLIDYDTWRMNTLSISEGLVIHQPPKDFRKSFSYLEISVDKIGGESAETPYSLANLRINASVEGEADYLPDGITIWVGTRKNDSDTWYFSGPAFVNSGDWNIPNAYFHQLYNTDENDQYEIYDVVALATKGHLPVSAVIDDELQWYALSTSPVSTVQSQNAGLVNFSSFSIASYSLIVFLIILGLLLALEYYFRLVSQVCNTAATVFEEFTAYLQQQFSDMPKPKVIPSALGIIILGLGLFAIIGYFPIYTHVLERVLNLTPDKSESLALLLIVFIGLAGVIVHLSIEYISESKGEFINRIFDYFLNYALPITVLLVTFALWGVQALLYLELYQGQVEPGNIRIPAAMGAAAFFIAGIETLGFYWATRLGIDFFAWFIFHVFIFGPPALLAKTFRILNVFFNALPNYGKTEEAADPPKEKKLGVAKS